MKGVIPRSSVMGLALSLAGASLDFVSGTSILQMYSMPATAMGSADPYAPAWAFFLYGLGALLVTTGVLGVTSMGMGRMKIFGGLMVIYGAIMLFVGMFMVLGMSPQMSGAAYSGMAMLLIGVGMIANGLGMSGYRAKM